VQGRTSKRLGWAIFVFGATSLFVDLVVTRLLHLTPVRDTGPLVIQVGTGAAFVLITLIGALVASRQPSNAMWWLFSVFGGLTLAIFTGDSLASGPLDRGTHAVLPRISATMSNTFGGPVVLMFLVFLLLLFPDGAPASRRWRRLTTFAVGWCLLFTTLELLLPGTLNNISVNRPTVNPIGIAVLAPLRKVLQGPAFLVLPILIICSAVSLFLRFRKAPSAQRQQIKLFVFAGVLVALVFIGGPVYFWRSYAPPWAWNVAFMLAILSLPTACGAAILRYRLYDIDRLISRTASYLLISAFLGGLFALIVLVPTAAIGSRTTIPSWLIAVATLAVAFLFQPVRRRVQRGVDQRFNRARYNAVNTLDSFAVRLRDEIDMETLQVELAAVITDTMQPVRVGLWLAPSRR
jgi:hypothetical protein